MLYLIFKVLRYLHSTEYTAILELPVVMGGTHLYRRSVY